jgi:hypothetical protein
MLRISAASYMFIRFLAHGLTQLQFDLTKVGNVPIVHDGMYAKSKRMIICPTKGFISTWHSLMSLVMRLDQKNIQQVQCLSIPWNAVWDIVSILFKKAFQSLVF